MNVGKCGLFFVNVGILGLFAWILGDEPSKTRKYCLNQKQNPIKTK